MIFFLDTNNNNVADHVGFWYDDLRSSYGKCLHAIGGDSGKVVLRPMYQSYTIYNTNGGFLDAAFVITTKRRKPL